MTSPSSVISPPTQHAETRSQQPSGQSNSNNRTSELSPIDEIASFNPTEKRSNAGRDESSTATDFAYGNKDKGTFEVTRPPATVVSSSANCQTQNSFDSQHLSNGSLVVDNLPSPVGTPRNLSPASQLKSQLEDLRQIQRKVSLRSEDAPRLPTRDDFLLSISVDIIAGDIDEPVKHIIILLHDYSGTETSLQSLARRLSTRQPNCAYVLLRATEPVSPGNSGYHWADSQNNHDEGFFRCSRRILMDVIQDCLISKCNFNPRNIILLGHCQGGMAALATVASWDQVEFGGVISIGGPMPVYTHLPSDVKARTPALIIRAELGDVTPLAMQCIKENFICVDSELRNGAHDTIPETPDELRPLLSFFAHRLEREEWEKQAILSLGKFFFFIQVVNILIIYG